MLGRLGTVTLTHVILRSWTRRRRSYIELGPPSRLILRPLLLQTTFGRSILFAPFPLLRTRRHLERVRLLFRFYPRWRSNFPLLLDRLYRHALDRVFAPLASPAVIVMPIILILIFILVTVFVLNGSLLIRFDWIASLLAVLEAILVLLRLNCWVQRRRVLSSSCACCLAAFAADDDKDADQDHCY